MNFERLSKVRALMMQEKFDHLIVTSPDSIYYLLDVEIHPGERMMALSISQTEVNFMVNALFPIEKELGVNLHYYSDTDAPVELLSAFLPDSGVLGIDKDWPSHFLLKLMKIKKDLKYEIGSPAVDMARLIKTENERQLMRNASRINDQVMGNVFEYLKTNRPTEAMVQDKVVKVNKSFDVYEMSFTPLICFGKNAAEPHHDSDETQLLEGDCIIIDIGGRKDGYCSDMTRSFHLGEPSEEYVKIYNLVKTANLTAISKVKPGVKLKEIDEAARNVITEGGYGPFFTHRTGHGIGINVHEFPDVSAINEIVCEEGMIFSIEPGIYLSDKYGVRIEDLVLVTKEGCEVLNAFPKELMIIK